MYCLKPVVEAPESIQNNYISCCEIDKRIICTFDTLIEIIDSKITYEKDCQAFKFVFIIS